MAEIVTVNGHQFKRRNIVAVWLGLPLVTIGVYTYVWYYKVNSEARRYLNDPSIRPGISLLAITLGWLLIVPPFLSIHNTALRVRRMQQQAGLTELAKPWVVVVLVFIYGLWTLYVQNALNDIWDRYLPLSGGYAPAQLQSPPAAALPPPPPSR